MISDDRSNTPKPTTRWWLRATLATVLFTSAIALSISIFTDDYLTWIAFVVSYSIGFSILSFEFVGSFLLSRFGSRDIRIIVIGAAGLLFGLFIAGVLVSQSPLLFLRTLTSTMIGLVTSTIACIYAIYALRLRDSKLKIEALTQAQLRREKELAIAKLQAIKSQVQPHFLFNALANVQSNIERNPELSIELISKLSDLLRATLDYANKTNATVRDELNLCELYLNVQVIRMSDRLTYEFEVDESLLDVAISPLLVQPLVENAVLHGIEPSHSGGHISIFVERLNANVKITVLDSGVGFETNQDGLGSHIGLSNLRERLKAFYANEARIEITEPINGGTQVELTLPLNQELSIP